MGFSRQEYQSGLPSPSPGDLPDPGIEPTFPVLQADSLPLSHRGSPKDKLYVLIKKKKKEKKNPCKYIRPTWMVQNHFFHLTILNLIISVSHEL